MGCTATGWRGTGFMGPSSRTAFLLSSRWCAIISRRQIRRSISSATYPAKSLMRNMLAHGTFRDAGSPYHFVVPLRVQTNGGFFGDWHLVANGSDDFLKRIGRDPNGALYKMYNTFIASDAANLGVNV